MATEDPQQKRIVFFHPDLGIGGAERLVIDAAVGLQSLGHKVTIFTSHCDKGHCFTEAKDGTLDVRVRGNWLFPTTIIGRFAILCAIARQIHLVLAVAVFSNELVSLRPTNFFVDQLSACVPFLRLLYPDAKTLFYCHFPDKLLAHEGTGWIRYAKLAYRLPFNWIESWSTGCSDAIVVNSIFTSRTVKDVFATLMLRSIKVVYPCVDTSAAQKSLANRKSLWPGKRILLSINRFERKKDIALAIKAYAGLAEKDRRSSRLVVAGGYDSRMAENVSYHKELETLATSLGLKHETTKNLENPSAVSNDVSVLFLLSVPDTLKQSLLDSATLLIYTPRNEHFGIVPLEAMLNGVPVLAANEGGPLETVVDEETGWLRDVADTAAWTAVIQDAFSKAQANPVALTKMGEAGRARVVDKFSKSMMASNLNQCLNDLKTTKRQSMVDSYAITAFGATFLAFIAALGIMALLYYKLERDTEWEKQYDQEQLARKQRFREL